MKKNIKYWVYQANQGRNPVECWQEINKIINKLIAEEMLIAHKENQPTSRLTSLSNKINNIK